VVIGYRGDLVRRELSGEPGIEFVEQIDQRGTGHAVMMCRSQLEQHQGSVLILAGDSPMTQVSSLRALLIEFDARRPACLLGTGTKPNPAGLGRVVRDATGQFLAIVEEKDATPEQRAINEVNLSTYVFAAAPLLSALDQLTDNNVQGEYYLTDCPSVLKAAGERVEAMCVLKPCEALSINTVEELAEVEAEMRKTSRQPSPPPAS
jgi:bifunctional UDP-N-acetylglucosamine pyrophosphorylase / glucosamine-1-phosphate N-acetyltransferase